jgi:hypothetical protein
MHTVKRREEEPVMDPEDHRTTEALQQQLAALDAHYQETLAHTAALAHQVQQQATATGQDASEGPARSAKTEEEIARMREEARTTPADLQQMLGWQSYPTWMHAAYADVTSRLARVEASIEDLGASIGLLHTKMETIIGQLAAQERPERAGEP